MKKTTRLTALLLALVLLLGTLSASATETGIPIEDFDFGTYSSIRTTAEEGGAPDITDCANCPEYCERVTYMLEECPTAQAKYEYLMTLYTEVPEDEVATQEDFVLEYTLLHYAECHVADKEDFTTYEVCTCAFPMFAPDSVPGDISKHDEECPWHFANLTTPEQYTVSIMLASYDETKYMATLSTEQAAAFAAYSDEMLGEDLTDPCGPDNTYCQYITNELPNMTASEIYDELNALYYEGLAEGEEGPSSEYVALMLHYGYYHTSSNLICSCGEHPLPLPEYEIGDISVHEEACPWHFANLTTPEQYSVICLLDEDKEVSYKATLKAPQYAALAVYTDAVENESGCGDTCEYADVVAMNGYDRYWYIKQLYDETVREGGYPSEEYITLYAHLRNDHIDDGLICQCNGFDITNTDYAYGSTKHTGSSFFSVEVECPWHFNKLPVAEQSKVLNAIHPDLWAGYTETLTADQYAELMAYLGKVSDSTVENKTEIPKSETTGAAAQITVPANVFGEGVDYIMNAEETTLSDAEAAAVAEAGGSNVLAVYDISFNDASNGAKINPVNGKVALTFTIETAKVIGSHIQVYHMKETVNADGTITYTAEPMGEPVAVDATKDVQTITVEADAFSLFAAAGTCDGDACKSIISAEATASGGNYIDNGDHTFNAMGGMTNTQMHAYINELYEGDPEGVSIEAFMLHLVGYHTDWTMENVCGCYVDLLQPLAAPGPENHAPECPWYEAEQPEQLEITVPEWNGESESIELSFAQTDAAGYVWEKGIENADGTITWTVIEGQTGATLTLDATVNAMKYLYRCTAQDADGNAITTSKNAALLPAEYREWLIGDGSGDWVTQEMLVRAVKAGNVDAVVLEGNELIHARFGGAIATYDAETGDIIDAYLGVAVAKYDPETGKLYSLYSANNG